ncbi:hypothetical protein GTA62_14765 [Roseobacter sp. HKCCD9010]|uniref:hypothetical protein n=1 Tax=unclassified Roseobacter TaxID=196798 RepID=UPI001491B825|nr:MULTISPECIES: hypothetical protein [unclassified Roseobacter]MBF9050627.1 hypothetical protein [Rhodobacterales bacterium HKCCD4356]NNV11955.1 hypothetical protein [Roseobacter sp. HKCCD7357]NNV16968.1 hypothetical protein [Roseobacter sp. HKCCD8768]NNV26197.1 hypothetical protein [Roseobacter sp. HKCCD8192]NNV30692.1 hypothetical protein [Roseobacter sp. HKCCD9061]
MTSLSAKTNRRAVLAGIPATLATGVASATTASALVKAFDRWLTLQERFNATDGDDLYAEITELEDQIISTTPASVHEYALKVVLAGSNGGMEMSVLERALAAEAREMTGINI